jgi:hypothetical protein
MSTSNSKKKGGGYRVAVIHAADTDTFIVPAGFKITNIVTKKIGTTAGNLTIGTAADGAQIVNTVAMGGSDAAIAVHILLLTVFSTTADQTCHINLSAATCYCDMYITMQRVN